MRDGASFCFHGRTRSCGARPAPHSIARRVMSAAFTHLKQIGAGCGGTVKLARRKADNKLYALKELELPRDPQEAASVL